MCSKSPMIELGEEMLALCHKYELMNFQNMLDIAKHKSSIPGIRSGLGNIIGLIVDAKSYKQG